MANSDNSLPNKVVEVMVDSIFRKNGLKSEDLKEKLSDDQKKMLKEMVEDLKEQVEQFNNKEKDEKK
ncbi:MULTISPECIES: hypothetical protein [Oceanobacillus]|uniref:Spore coat protein n=1 Tax=Oceanobacillus kimchii TaxID=746691 RepID=A0ABQ5TH10_9BACI|nr:MULTISPECIES: hypothetical protein [Oceanobacillus]MBT2652835.1 spore coat protein [Oceanobacillus sp. ISL-73]MCT1577379.1 spore coat protein [Oceanobacillus kimchii]MCT2136985.1 spore coat protein [Oceanobacillus kimchii]OEH53582.1 spore coat protein [Oceanobacillus sp. E9]GLO64904.1 hypothetical protein MACH08_06880 [Oceanobacillus kimchii]